MEVGFSFISETKNAFLPTIIFDYQGSIVEFHHNKILLLHQQGLIFYSQDFLWYIGTYK